MIDHNITKLRNEVCAGFFTRDTSYAATTSLEILVALAVDRRRVLAERDALMAALERGVNFGHNDDCLFCGFKDRNATVSIAAAKETP